MGLPQLIPLIFERRPAIVNLKDMVWSYSRLSTFERCQRMFYYQYIEKRPIAVSVPLKIGRIIHQAVQWCIAEGYEPTEALQYALYENNGYPDGETFKSLLSMVSNALHYVPSSENVRSEIHLKIQTVYGKIQGIIDILNVDLLDDSVEIVDFKTGWQPADITNNKQLSFYGWLYTELAGSSFSGDITVKLVYPRINHVVEHVLTEDDIEDVKRWFMEIVQSITAKSMSRNDWEKTCDKSVCEHCPFAGLCSGDFNGIFPNSADLTNVNEAVAMGEYIAHQEVLLKKYKKALRKFIEKGNQVRIGEMEWYLHESESKPKIEAKSEWLEHLESLGLDIADYVDVDSSKINEILQQVDVEELEKLKQLIIYTTPRKTLKYGRKSENEK